MLRELSLSAMESNLEFELSLEITRYPALYKTQDLSSSGQS